MTTRCISVRSYSVIVMGTSKLQIRLNLFRFNQRHLDYTEFLQNYLVYLPLMKRGREIIPNCVGLETPAFCLLVWLLTYNLYFAKWIWVEGKECDLTVT